MARKTISLITLVAFIIFSTSCAIYKTKKEKIETVAAKKGKGVQILAVLKTSGEQINLSKKQPARIIGAKIEGTTEKKETIEIRKDQIKKMSKERKKITEITTIDGKVYSVSRVISEDKNNIVIESVSEFISIPLSEVELVWVKRVDPAMTFLATIGGIVLLAGGIVAIALATKESCPFIYSFDGEMYMFDAEPYGGATCEGLKRTEWCGLEHLKEVNGQYKIKITNEVDETQYTDELKLVIVDHPKGVGIVPDEFGGIHTISQPIIPLRAYDEKGMDLMPYISENDWIFWQTQDEEKNPERKEELKDELIFEFPKPEGAKKTKLLFNGCNTLWASQMVKRYLDLYGSEVYECYEKMKSPGPASLMAQWNSREELYRLQIRVESKDGWESKGMIVGGGPFISEDKIYTLDLSDVSGETLKIKLTPPPAFWMINYLAVDYTDDLPVQTREIGATLAADGKGQDVKALLAQTDNSYLIMPNIGDSAEVSFQAPSPKYDQERSVILKASGYYDIHLETKGEPQREILNKFLAEPGFASQYAFKEYVKWKKENAEKFKRNE